jgi:hypothetical protein
VAESTYIHLARKRLYKKIFSMEQFGHIKFQLSVFVISFYLHFVGVYSGGVPPSEVVGLVLGGILRGHWGCWRAATFTELHIGRVIAV